MEILFRCFLQSLCGRIRGQMDTNPLPPIMDLYPHCPKRNAPNNASFQTMGTNHQRKKYPIFFRQYVSRWGHKQQDLQRPYHVCNDSGYDDYIPFPPNRIRIQTYPRPSQWFIGYVISFADQPGASFSPLAPEGPSTSSNRLASLVDCSSQLIASSISHETRASYEANYNSFKNFLISQQFPTDLPSNPGHVVLYIAHLFLSGLASSTIVSKLSSISYFHKLYSQQDPIPHFLVQKTLLGAKKLRPSSDTRQPITYPLLMEIINIFSKNIRTSYLSTLYKAMISLSFFACLRPGEVTSSQNNIQFTDVLVSHQNISVTFHCFKHYQGRPVTIVIPKQGGKACPWLLLNQFLAIRGNQPGPFFAHSNGSPVLYSEYRKLFVQINSQEKNFHFPTLLPNCRSNTSFYYGHCPIRHQTPW